MCVHLLPSIASRERGEAGPSCTFCAVRSNGQWPRRIVQAMEQAPKYPEGTGLRLAVKSSRDIATLLKLAVIKLAN